jgi:hypothetical protein
MNKMNGIMKKTYINPSIVVVRLATIKHLAVVSEPNTTLSNDENDAIAPGSFGTKGISDVNVWDNEW